MWSVKVIVASPLVVLQATESVKSFALHANAVPATPSEIAAAAEATPRVRTIVLVRRDMDTSSPNWIKPERLEPQGMTSTTRREAAGVGAGKCGK